ncbi:MAG: hypothetical protein CMJ59_00160 [Planctomycetaceae bacterium]|nr:hypothetical protein [Planctomycetaceae bacterium]
MYITHATAVFKDGGSEIFEGFKDPDCSIRHNLCVGTEFNSDNEGHLNRMPGSITLPRQAEPRG